MKKASKLNKSIVGISCQPTIVYNNLSQTHPALEKYLGFLFHRVTLIYRSAMMERFEKLKIQGPHFAILSMIEHTPSITQNQLCQETGIDKASMVKLTDHLQDLKLIERKEAATDRRVKNLTLTKHGQKVFAEATKIRLEFENEFLSQLTKEEQTVFKNTLRKLINLKK
ncbi:MarR family winged helix-turn-helix transcriptional regulator [Pseudobdellovibrio sp. HCB154]|uniref:MarR family winged helix-turn-helix transcriptional regulator n=1 Tax=Pseudobdellovibrio sp. HCB154 TaxID=3386277 RepID=UPI0039170804